MKVHSDALDYNQDTTKTWNELGQLADRGQFSMSANYVTFTNPAFNHIKYQVLDEDANGNLVYQKIISTDGSDAQKIHRPGQPIKRVNEFTLAPTQEPFCYLTQLSGKFDGGGEGANIYERGGNWILRVHSLDNKFVQAGATCMRYDQTHAYNY